MFKNFLLEIKGKYYQLAAGLEALWLHVRFLSLILSTRREKIRNELVWAWGLVQA